MTYICKCKEDLISLILWERVNLSLWFCRPVKFNPIFFMQLITYILTVFSKISVTQHFFQLMWSLITTMNYLFWLAVVNAVEVELTVEGVRVDGMGLDESLWSYDGPLGAGEPVHRLHSLTLLCNLGQCIFTLAGPCADVEEKCLGARELVGDAVVAVPVLGADVLHVKVPVLLLTPVV